MVYRPSYGVARLAAFVASVFMCEPFAQAQAPSTETLTLSLRTISKALAVCRGTYTQFRPGTTVSVIKRVLGTGSYEKDMSALGSAEKLTDALIESPERISGQALVMVLSLSDDFAIGAASTQTDLLMKLIESHFDGGSPPAQEILLSASALSACQRSLFNAGDDYVSLVTEYVRAEDRALTRLQPTHP